MLNSILEIGPKLARLNLDHKRFSIESQKLIKEVQISSDLKSFSDDLSKWMLNSKIPKQLNVYNAFGQPPITVFSNEKFVVDIYFWLHADTSIHSHAFSGSFKVLFGKSLHEIFDLVSVKKFSGDVILNKIKRTGTEILIAGDSRKILSGPCFNHRVVHLSSPTVTLCVRTISDDKIPQWHYFDNGLSILKRELDESVLKKLFYADYLFEVNENIATNFLRSFIDSLEPSELINLFEQLSVDTMGLQDYCQEYVYNIMMDRLSNLEWFDLYESNCEKSQSLETSHDESESSKFQAHANFYEYDQGLTSELIKKL